MCGQARYILNGLTGAAWIAVAAIGIGLFFNHGAAAEQSQADATPATAPANNPANPPTELMLWNDPPYISATDGKVTGFLAELVFELMDRAGLPYQKVYGSFPLGLMALKTSRMALALDFARIPEREKEFQWVQNVASFGEAFLTLQPQAKINGIADALALKAIAVEKGTYKVAKLSRLGLTNLTETYEPIDCARLLQAGRVNAWYTEADAAVHIWKSAGFDPRLLVVGAIQDSSDSYIVANLGYPPENIKRIRATWKTMVADGTVNRYLGR
jgi:hypothetical protein